VFVFDFDHLLHDAQITIVTVCIQTSSVNMKTIMQTITNTENQ